MKNNRIFDFFSKKPLSFWLFLPIFLYVFFALQHVTKFETADEHFWFGSPDHDRIHQYWNAVANRDWKSTRINDKPGVSLALFSGVSILFEKKIPGTMIESGGGEYASENPEKIQQVNFLFRFPQILLTALSLIYFFWVLKKIFKNEFVALLSVTLIALSPVLIGISQIVNPDAMLWIFSFASATTFFLFLQEGKKWQAVLVAVFFGMALLSKYAALMLIPFFSASIFFFALFNFEKWDRAELKKKMLQFSQGYLMIILGAFAMFSILMPAVLVDPMLAYKSTIGFKGMQYVFWPLVSLNLLLLADSVFAGSLCAKWVLQKMQFAVKILPKVLYVFLAGLALLTLFNWLFKNNLMNVASVAFDSGDGGKYNHASLFDQLILQFRPIVFSLTPLVLFSVLFLWIKAIFGKIKNELLVFLLTIFIAVFYLAVMKQGLLITIRYGIILYPVLMTLGALGIFELFNLEKRTKIFAVSISLVCVVFSLISIWQIKPFYFNYTSDLLPKENIITGAWGYGGYEAADFLNHLPDAKNMTVWSDYYGVCPFFVGKCVSGFTLKSHLKKNSLDDIDYVVATRRGKSQNKNMWHKFDYSGLSLKWSLLIDERSGNFVKVYKNEGQKNPDFKWGIY